MPVCSKCRQEKPLDAFNPAPRLKSGRENQCRECRVLAKRYNYHRRAGHKHREPFFIRFWCNVDCTGGADACWVWNGTLHESGYGTMGTTYPDGRKKHTAAHRLVYIMTHGDIPEGMSVLHRCDNKRCVNVFRHLFLGTQSDNMRDFAEKGFRTQPQRTYTKVVRATPERKKAPGRNQHTPLSPEQRFWEKVDTSGGKDACWFWQGTVTGGYGGLTVNGKATRAHRFSYQLAYGEPAKGLWVLHRCDQPLCVNPTHLFLGTRQQNTADMVAKRRHHHYLSDEEICAIYVSRGIASSRILAQQYRVSARTIFDIWHKRRHKILLAPL